MTWWWLAEIIGRHQCGFAVPPGDPVAFADALCQAADDPAERLRMGARARQLAAAEYDRALLAARFVAWLEGAVVAGSDDGQPGFDDGRPGSDQGKAER